MAAKTNPTEKKTPDLLIIGSHSPGHRRVWIIYTDIFGKTKNNACFFLQSSQYDKISGVYLGPKSKGFECDDDLGKIVHIFCSSRIAKAYSQIKTSQFFADSL